MNARSLTRRLAAAVLTLALCAVALGDTIRMKDGQVIRGQIISFRDQQFTVLIGTGSGGRRSRLTVYMEDVESIEFDNEGGAADTGGPSRATEDYAAARPEPARPQPTPQRTEPRPEPQRPTLGGTNGSNTGGTTPRANTGAAPAPGGAGDSQFFPVRIRVRADNSANGWTDSGLMVRKGQRLRISATGRVSLGQGRFSTPTGLPRIVDTEKLMRNEPTGALIAVIGDDNDEFIFIGSSRDFYATRDGRLFLGVNEGNLADNTGTYDALIEVEPVTSGGR
jgi:hypothetical protein